MRQIRRQSSFGYVALRAGAILAIAVIALFAINEVVFRFYPPPGLHDPDWIGRWGSASAHLVSGGVALKLPKRLSDGAKFRASARIYYDLWSIYRPGQSFVVSLDGRLTRIGYQGSGSGPKRPAGPLVLSLRATGDIRLEYTAVVDGERRHIVGGYVWTSPSDAGWFSANPI